MLLVIDVGNTHTVLGLFERDSLHVQFRITSEPRTTDELGCLLLQLFDVHSLAPTDVHGAIVSSVVPSVLYTVEKACRRYLEVEPLVVGRGVKTGMRIRTDNPREVGADRIVNAVAAVQQWGSPIVVVDFGTATTFDCVDARGDYVGGAIAPGLKISEEALFSRTAKLPRVDIARPRQAIGTNTITAIQSGLFWGYVGLVDGLAHQVRSELDPRAPVVATGGLATLVASASEEIREVAPRLTLRGLHILYHRNQGRPPGNPS